jgi:hypothetical protein
MIMVRVSVTPASVVKVDAARIRIGMTMAGHVRERSGCLRGYSN